MVTEQDDTVQLLSRVQRTHAERLCMPPLAERGAMPPATHRPRVLACLNSAVSWPWAWRR